MNLFTSRVLRFACVCVSVVASLIAAHSFAETDSVALLNAAARGDAKARYAAIDDLGENQDDPDQVVPALQKLLSDADPQIRWRSARSLGDFDGLAQSAAGDLLKLLEDPDPIVQYHAAVALGRVNDRSDATVAALVAAATSTDERVARAAISALRHLKPGPQRVMAALKEVLKSDDEAVVLYALEAIAEQGAASTPLLNEALKEPETSYLACAAIEQIGPDAKDTVPALTELLRDTKHSHLLTQALLALASIGPAAQGAEDAVASLLEMSTDATVPVAAAYALGAIGAKNADVGLKKALTKDDPFLQMIAAWALAKTHPGDETLTKQAVDKLIHGLGSDQPQIRQAAAKGLQMLNAPPELVAPVLIQMANDSDPEVVTHVIQALATRGETIVPRAIKALQNPELRGLAVRLLTELGPKAGDAVGPLLETAKGADPALRTQIHFALAAIGPAAAPATAELSKAIMSEDAGESESALYALREIGPGAKAAVVPLSAVMQKDDSFNSLAAAWALARIAPDDAKVAELAVPKLTAALAHDDEQTRLECVEALAAWGSAAKAAAPTLKAIEQADPSPAVRASAKAALAKIGS